MDNLVRDLAEWCPHHGADAWPIMRQAAAEIRSLRAQMEQEQERVGIVAWLRGTPHGNWQAIANAIERHEDKEPSA